MPEMGGTTRDGWYGMGIGNKKLLRQGVAADAVLVKIRSMSDIAQYDVTIQIRPAGEEPYEVQGLFRVPRHVVGRLSPGLTLPVKVHPSKPKRVAIDWGTWEASQASNT